MTADDSGPESRLTTGGVKKPLWWSWRCCCISHRLVVSVSGKGRTPLILAAFGDNKWDEKYGNEEVSARMSSSSLLQLQSTPRVLCITAGLIKEQEV